MEREHRTSCRQDGLVGFSVALIKHSPKANLGLKGFIWLACPDHGHLRQSEAGTMEESIFSGLFSWLSYTIQNYLARSGTVHI